MATLYTHAVVGLTLGKAFTPRKLPWLFWGLAILLPILPDADGFSPAVYGNTWGHRGFTHSLLFALFVAAIAAGATFRYFRVNFWDLLGFFFVVTASHGILDALTNGGYGIPFFWPLSERRYGPVGPIQVSDIGFEWPDPRVSRSIRTELLWVWLPAGLVVGTIACYRRWRKKRDGVVAP